MKIISNRFEHLKKQLREGELTREEFIEDAEVCCTNCKHTENRIKELEERIEKLERNNFGD
jgi:polyhydroxyalkanoate synthesis regulator phasin